jgi:hypothetical protein
MLSRGRGRVNFLLRLNKSFCKVIELHTYLRFLLYRVFYKKNCVVKSGKMTLARRRSLLSLIRLASTKVSNKGLKLGRVAPSRQGKSSSIKSRRENLRQSSNFREKPTKGKLGSSKDTVDLLPKRDHGPQSQTIGKWHDYLFDTGSHDNSRMETKRRTISEFSKSRNNERFSDWRSSSAKSHRFKEAEKDNSDLIERKRMREEFKMMQNEEQSRVGSTHPSPKY